MENRCLCPYRPSRKDTDDLLGVGAKLNDCREKQGVVLALAAVPQTQSDGIEIRNGSIQGR